MGDGKKSDAVAGFSSDSAWPLTPDDSDDLYFFQGDRESSILSEFGWSLHPDSATDARLEDLGRIEPGAIHAEATAVCSGAASASASGADPQGGAGEASTSNPSVSSCSSEDPPEKSTGSGGKLPDTPERSFKSKARKKGQKRIRQPRFAFMTRSEVDHLEDGYRWRKYGQKAVKNSPFPRSYYRCTNSKCTVKKRVERSSEDPAIVITTYEGQHCHHSVGFPRGGILNHESAFAGQFTNSSSQFYYPGIQLPRDNPLCATRTRQPNDIGESQVVPKPAAEYPTNEGLLGDIVPPLMRNT